MSITRRSACFVAAAFAIFPFVLTATASAAAKPTVTIVSTVDNVVSYKKSFPVKSCSFRGTTGVTLAAEDDDGYALTVKATKLRGTLWIRGGDDDDAIDIRGKVASVARSGPPARRKVTVKGAFTSGDARGVFTITGDCP